MSNDRTAKVKAVGSKHDGAAVRPCPFCGGTNLSVRVPFAEGSPYVRCCTCFAAGPSPERYRKDRDAMVADVIAGWNGAPPGL